MPSLDFAGLTAVLAAGVRPLRAPWAGHYATSGGEILSVRAPGRGGGTTGKATILTPRAHHRTGHLRVRLYRGRDVGGHADVYVHRLVCAAWWGPPSSELVTLVGGDERDVMVLHAPDHRPDNNRPENLTWGTRNENGADLSRRCRDENTGEIATRWARHEAAQAICGRMGVHLADPRWGF